MVTIETTKDFLPEVELNIPKVQHHAISPLFSTPYILAKASLQLHAVRKLVQLVKLSKADLIIAKGSMAGALASILHDITGVSFTVESFEPHSSYMVECGVWNKTGSRYRFSRYFEQRQLKHAKYIITVTENYRDDLIRDGHSPDRIHVIPSIVDLDRFRFQEADKHLLREKLGIPHSATVGIYVGKYGGLYYDEEAFLIYAQAFARFSDLHIIILSPSDHFRILEQARRVGLPLDRIHVRTVSHMEIPAHLSAADFAFSTIRPSPTKLYQCPIKNSEYWANGLPILMTDEVGDEHKLLRKGIGGRVFKVDLSDVSEALAGIEAMIQRPGHREEVASLAKKYRSTDIIRRVYSSIFHQPFERA